MTQIQQLRLENEYMNSLRQNKEHLDDDSTDSVFKDDEELAKI